MIHLNLTIQTRHVGSTLDEVDSWGQNKQFRGFVISEQSFLLLNTDVKKTYVLLMCHSV